MKNYLTLAVIAYLTSTIPAHAYIDPITGSFILQALIGGFAAAMVAIRRVRVKILSLLGIVKEEETSMDSEASEKDTKND